ncbi:hypothetical protein AVEN_124209-1 [Araneus ventricosus]|uniref:t-SNARE coiled-coil homology domain-containing protein n=1 Tax=Araneus ventricosus TaxID=182803 RepID=A0A4Y2N1J6_ARAVE|nr:hypothetical protein AVEN_124209-1 [Araneus ventricosus]
MVENIERRVENIERKVENIERIVENIERRVENIERRVENIERGLGTNKSDNSFAPSLNYVSRIAVPFHYSDFASFSTRGLFCDGPRNFEPRSHDEDDTRVGAPSSNFHTTPTGRRLTPCLPLNVQQVQYTTDFSGIRFRTWDPPSPEPRPYY